VAAGAGQIQLTPSWNGTLPSLTPEQGQFGLTMITMDAAAHEIFKVACRTTPTTGTVSLSPYNCLDVYQAQVAQPQTPVYSDVDNETVVFSGPHATPSGQPVKYKYDRVTMQVSTPR
jgi:hypothetical protein